MRLYYYYYYHHHHDYYDDDYDYYYYYDDYYDDYYDYSYAPRATGARQSRPKHVVLAFVVRSMTKILPQLLV